MIITKKIRDKAIAVFLAASPVGEFEFSCFERPAKSSLSKLTSDFEPLFPLDFGEFLFGSLALFLGCSCEVDPRSFFYF